MTHHQKPATSPKKGSSLEEAVKIIYESILASRPDLKGTPFTVERNKIIHLNGRHEIDVFVRTSTGSDFESTFLFECKDWTDPVGTPAVHVLSSKVDTLNATAGFLVARAITQDAQDLLKSKPRLTFVRCAADLTGPLNTVSLLHSVHDPQARTVSFRFRGLPPADHPPTLDWQGKSCLLHGQPVDLHAILEPWFAQMITRNCEQNTARYSQPGTHEAALSGRISFQPAEFLFDNHDVEYLDIFGRYFVTIERHHPSFKFELDGRGRVVVFGMDIEGNHVEIQLVKHL